MSAIATVLAAMGHEVSGSDRSESATLARLRRGGVAAASGQDPSRVAGVDLVAHSAAVPASDPELVAAGAAGIAVATRAELLAAICSTRETIAVAGTKGKTTTAAMLAAILDHAGWSPCVLVGGEVAGIAGGARWDAASRWLVAEADESDGAFLQVPASHKVVTNVEADHLDHYGDLAALRNAFAEYLAAAPATKVVGTDTDDAATVAAEVGGCVTYSTEAGRGSHTLSVLAAGRSGVAFRLSGPMLDASFDLSVPGVHNARNASAAVLAAVSVGADVEAAKAALSSYREVSRRFEVRGEEAGVTVIDDYAHLPSAIRAAIGTARQGGWRRVVALYQPHLYSRTLHLGAEMGAELAAADVVFVTDVYPARESPIDGVDGALVAAAARASAPPGVDVSYVASRSRVAAEVAGCLREGDVCLVLGAGDITEAAGEILGLLGGCG